MRLYELSAKKHPEYSNVLGVGRWNFWARDCCVASAGRETDVYPNELLFCHKLSSVLSYVKFLVLV